MAVTFMTGLVTTSVLYLVGLSFYRLYLHPLAKVPGPTLAALTGWYEAYYDLLHKGLGGQYTFHIRELHQVYGPIVRISPVQVHIDDPFFYATIYTNKDGLDKPAHLRWRFGSPSALFSTPEHHIHKMRRAAQDPFFSRGRIMKLSSAVIQAKATQMCTRLADDYASHNRPVNLDAMFASFSADVALQYSFDRDFNWLAYPDFGSPFLKAIQGFKNIAHPCAQFPWLARALLATPEFIVRIVQPAMSAVIDFQNGMRRMVRNAQKDVRVERKRAAVGTSPAAARRETIFHGILRADLPETEMDMEVLKDHAVGLLGAGVASVQTTLKIAAFHIIQDGDICRKLQEELAASIADPRGSAPLGQVLEKLPYLSACVQEALRLACGQMTRSPRVAQKTIMYGTHALPAGTLISLDTWHMHHNESLFPSSFSFVPERWLGQATCPPPHDNLPLKHFMVAFGRGTRNCIGINLAHAEMMIALASLFRRFAWELYETTDQDVQVVRDVVAPDTPQQSKGVRALVRELEQ